MGSGKTKVACDLVRRKLDCVDAVIWIAPASLAHSEKYISEVKRWSRGFFKKSPFYHRGDFDERFQVYGNAQTRRDAQKFLRGGREHFHKNIRALRTKRLVADYKLFDFRLILNGTPITKSLLDLYSQISFLSPNILKMTERQFADNFLVYFSTGSIPSRGGGGRSLRMSRRS